jgi:hypothetical protein
MHIHPPSPFLVIIDQIDIRRVLALELEYDPPVTRDPHRLLSPAITDQRMHSEPGRIHHCRRAADVELRQDQLDLPDMLARQATGTSGREQSFQPFVAEPQYHLWRVPIGLLSSRFLRRRCAAGIRAAIAGIPRDTVIAVVTDLTTAPPFNQIDVPGA